MSITSSSVSHIKYTERSSHSNGRSCARLEQLKILSGPSRQAYLRNISDEIIGSSAKKQPFLIRKIASSFHKDDKDMILEALLRLVKWSVTGRETEVRKKFSSIFFPTFGDLHHTVKRKKETQSKKGKKLSTATITLEPCKPSQLSTVTPYERPLSEPSTKDPGRLATNWKLSIMSRTRSKEIILVFLLKLGKSMKLCGGTSHLYSA